MGNSGQQLQMHQRMDQPHRPAALQHLAGRLFKRRRGLVAAHMGGGKGPQHLLHRALHWLGVDQGACRGNHAQQAGKTQLAVGHRRDPQVQQSLLAVRAQFARGLAHNDFDAGGQAAAQAVHQGAQGIKGLRIAHIQQHRGPLGLLGGVF